MADDKEDDNPNSKLDIPDPITFAISEDWLNRTLYPKQVTMLKCIFLRDDLFTDYDYKTIEKWEDSWRATSGTDANNGTPPGLINRIKQMQRKRERYIAEFGYYNPRGWLNEVIFVLGRRAGKGYILAIAMAYVIWCYMATVNPQHKYQIDRSKRLECQIYAGRKEQARDNLWRDLVNVIIEAPAFQPYISKSMGESLTVHSPKSWWRRWRQRVGYGLILSGLDIATFRIVPLPAVPMAGRGQAGFIVGMDEMAHMVATGANRSAEEIWKAVTPSLGQFGLDKFIGCPSSPWEMTGQFYVEWEQAQQINPETGEFLYPEKWVLQLASWEPYDDWELTKPHPRNPETGEEEYLGFELFPGDISCKDCVGHDAQPKPHKWAGDLGEYRNIELPRLQPLTRPVQAYDDEMQLLEQMDPDSFAVERRSYWQTTVDAYLDPKKIMAMFKPWPDPDGEGLPMTTHGALGTYYKAHADPGFVNDPYAVSVAHTVEDEDGFLHVIFDHIHHWEPHEFDEHTIDYDYITNELWKLVRDFPLDDLSFDQHQSRGHIADLSRMTRETRLPKKCQIHLINENAPYNLQVAQTFKMALNMGWIHAPYYEPAELELKFLQFKNGKVIHQTAGPVQHDDVARSMMEVVFHHLERQVSTHLMQGASLSATMSGGAKPRMHPNNGPDEEIINQMASSVRRGRTGFAPNNPARGASPFASGGRGPLPRTGASRFGAGRGRGR